MFFAAGLLLAAALNPYLAGLVKLPLIVPIDLKLRDIGGATLPDAGTRQRSVTNIGLVIIRSPPVWPLWACWWVAPRCSGSAR